MTERACEDCGTALRSGYESDASKTACNYCAAFRDGYAEAEKVAATEKARAEADVARLNQYITERVGNPVPASDLLRAASAERARVDALEAQCAIMRKALESVTIECTCDTEGDQCSHYVRIRALASDAGKPLLGEHAQEVRGARDRIESLIREREAGRKTVEEHAAKVAELEAEVAALTTTLSRTQREGEARDRRIATLEGR